MRKNCTTCANNCVKDIFIQEGAQCYSWKMAEILKQEFANNIDLNTYIKDVHRTWQKFKDYDAAVTYAALGLGGEAGEVQEVLKKAIFQGHDLNRFKLIEEIGDVFYYMILLMEYHDISLKQVIDANIEKRKKRYPDGFDADKSINRGD